MAERNFYVPSVDQQMANLEPSRELVEYYRNKLARCEEENEHLKLKLEEYLKVSDQRHNLEEELIKKGDKIRALQKGLNDIQQCLFHEREHVLKLYAENDNLKLCALESHERILELLAMTGNADLHDKVVYIFNEPPLNISICERRTRSDEETQTKVKQVPSGSRISYLQKKPTKSTDLLKSEVDALQLQLQEHKKLAKEQLEAMAETYSISSKEADARMMMDKEKIRSLSGRLKRTEELLHLSTCDFIELNKAVRKKEVRWATEKDVLIQNLNSAVKNVVDSSEMKTLVKEVTEAIKAADELMKSGSKLDINGYIAEREREKEKEAKALAAKKLEELEKPKRVEGEGKEKDKETALKRTRASYCEEVKILQQELNGIKNLNKTYRIQCGKLEDALNQLKDDHKTSMDLHKKRAEILGERLQSSNNQLKRLEIYRKSELEGYKTDIKNLKQRICELEKQLLKAVLLFEQGEKDMELLRTVHKTAVHSKKAAGEIRLLKAKLYELETELKSL